MLQSATGGWEHNIVAATDGPGGLDGHISGTLDMYFDLGAYAVEPNQGHVDPEGVNFELPGLREFDSVLSFRASAESARFAAALATEMYGSEPHHG